MMQRINVTELKRRLEHENSITLLDVREPWEYEICRIHASVNVPMSQIVNRMDELDKNAQIIVICHHGARSFQVASYLESCGFKHTVNLEGGISAWANQIDKLMPEY